MRVRGARVLLLAALLSCMPACVRAQASPSTSIHVNFTPMHLGHGTTLQFNARITPTEGLVPPPLTELTVLYPSALGVTVSGLGLATCTQSRLEDQGLRGCPANSHMGEGSALAEIPIGPEILTETASVAILRAPEQEGHLALLLYATGISPVFAQLAFPGLLLPSPPPYGASIHINVPLVPSLPGGPDVSVVKMHATLGPRGLTYYETVHGKVVGYKPKGILLPRRCPAGGFSFHADFSFLDGDHSEASTRVPCPRKHP
jgi:hypothetical protein